MKAKPKIVFFLLFIVILFSGCLTPHVIDDSIYQTNIIGIWQKTYSNPSFSMDAITEFKSNGEFSITAIQKNNDGTQKDIYVNGNWRIEKGYMIQVVVKSNIAAAGNITKDKILNITDKEFTYITIRNEIVTYKKKN
jgi:hypothetical protein